MDVIGVLMMAIACQAQPSAPGVATVAANPAPAAPASTGDVIAGTSADLDGDGRPERISLVISRDRTAAQEGMDRGELRVRVTSNDRVLESRAMNGVALPLVVAQLGSGERRTTAVVAGADHCGGSCAGMELIVVTVRDGKLVTLLDLEDASLGDVVVTREGALELRAPDSEGDAARRERVTRYELRDGALVETAETARAASAPKKPPPRIRVEAAPARH